MRSIYNRLSLFCLTALLVTACGGTLSTETATPPADRSLPTLPVQTWRLATTPISRANVDQISLIGNLVEHTATVNTLSFARTRNWMISTDGVAIAYLWDMNTGRRIAQISQPNPSDNTEGDVLQGFFGADDSSILLRTTRGTLKLLNPANFEVVREVPGGTGGISDVLITPDGETLINTTPRGEIRLWNARDLTPRTVYEIANSRLYAPTISRDGTRLAVAALDQNGVATIRVYRLSDGQVAIINAPPILPQQMVFSPDGTSLATGGIGGLATYDLGSGKVRYNIREAELRGGLGLTFSPDGRLLLSVGGGDVVYVYDAQSGSAYNHLARHANAATSVAFSPDGTLLLTTVSSAGASAYIWAVESIQADAKEHLRSSIGQGSNGFFFGTWSPDGKLLILADASGGMMIYGIQ